MTSIWRRSLAWHVYQLKLLASYALFDCVGDERNVTELNAVGFFGWKVPWLHQIASHLARRLLLMALGGGTAQTAKPSAEWLTEKMWSRLWSFGAGNTSHESSVQIGSLGELPGFASWTNWAKAHGTNLRIPSRLSQTFVYFYLV